MVANYIPLCCYLHEKDIRYSTLLFPITHVFTHTSTLKSKCKFQIILTSNETRVLPSKELIYNYLFIVL